MMKARTLWTMVALLALAGCIPATTTGPSIARTLTTPSTPLTYGWVMVDNGSNWGVQIGPKVDASGTHVAVYAWQSCGGAYTNCVWSYFKEFDPLNPGSIHDYQIVWDNNGWDLNYDGHTLVTLNPGSDNPRFEMDTGEHTTQ